MSAPRRKPYQKIDLIVHRIVRDSTTNHVFTVQQIIEGPRIYRIAEGIEYQKSTVLWIEGEDEPMTIDCEIGEFYQAWGLSRKNHHLNQQI